MRIVFYSGKDPVRLSGGMIVVCLLVDSLRRMGHDATAMVREPPPGWVPAGVDWTVSQDDPTAELASADAVVVGMWNVEEALATGAPRVAQMVAGNDMALWPSIHERLASIYSRPTTKLVITDHLRRALLVDPGVEAVTIGTPIDLEAFGPRRWRRRGSGPPRVLSVGADLEGIYAPLPFKGIATQMELVKRAREAGDLFEFVRMAPRADRYMDSDLIDRKLIGFDLGSRNSRDFGWEEHRRNVARVYRESDIYLSCSTEQEGLGIPAIEAAVSGVASVLPRIPSYAEIPELEQCALLHEPGDTEEALHNLRRLIADRDLRRKLGRAGPNLGLKERFDPDSVARRLLAALGYTSPA